MLGAAGMGLLLGLSVARTPAQDVIVSDPVPVNPPESGLQVPTFRSRPRPDYPKELRKAEVVGYALLFQNVRDDGKLATFFVEATNPYLEDAFYMDHASNLKPAVRGGKQVDIDVWYSAIFNPTSADTDRADASPRLLTVKPLFAPTSAPKLKKTLVARAALSLDETGKVTRVELVSPEAEPLRAVIEEGVREWSFAPARRNGSPVAGSLTVPVIVMPTWTPMDAKKMRLPVVQRQQKPIYPYSMRRGGFRGEVTVQFVVDTEGRVREPSVRRSNNPMLDAPALDAVRQWRFKPGTLDGQPVNVRMMVPMIFQLNTVDGGDELVTIKPAKNQDQSRIPEEFRFDIPPKPRGVVLPVYPYSLLRAKTKGSATVVYAVDKQGKVISTRVVEATHPEFGLSLAASVNAYEFTPALKNGVETNALVSLKQEFEPGSPSGMLGSEDLLLLRDELKHPERIVTMRELDTPLKPTSRRSPVFPCTAPANITRGEAVVEFLVDREGKVRLPRLVSATDPSFGYSAVQAVRDWTFEQPIAKKHGVTVRVRVPFLFKLEDSPPENTASTPANAGSQPTS